MRVIYKYELLYRLALKEPHYIQLPPDSKIIHVAVSFNSSSSNTDIFLWIEHDQHVESVVRRGFRVYRTFHSSAHLGEHVGTVCIAGDFFHVYEI